MKKILWIVVTIIASTGVQAQLDTTNSTFGKGIRTIARDSSFSMRFGIRFQTLYEAKTDIDNAFLNDPQNDVNDKFLIRRSRLKFDGFAFSPKFHYKIELGLSNRDIGSPTPHTNNANRIILDAVGKWNFAKNTWLWFGQTKLPGNRERVISSANLQLVDRSLLNKQFTLDRDVGLQLRHKFVVGREFEVRSIGALSIGEGRNITADNRGGYEWTGRVEILPFGSFTNKGDYFGADLAREETPKLSLAFTYDLNDDAVRERGNQGSYMEEGRDLRNIQADMMFKFKGFSVMAEYAHREADQPVVYGADEVVSGAFYTGTGFNVQGGYVFENGWSFDGRYTFVDPEEIVGREFQEQYTLGISKYIVGHSLKVQSDISYLEDYGSPNPELMYRIQADIHF